MGTMLTVDITMLVSIKYIVWNIYLECDLYEWNELFRKMFKFNLKQQNENVYEKDYKSITFSIVDGYIYILNLHKKVF